MDKFYTVVIDTKGSDKGPETIIAGACKALEMFPNLKLCLTGDTSVIETETKKLGADAKRIIIVEAPETITNYDHPVMAIQSKQNSSFGSSMCLPHFKHRGSSILLGILMHSLHISSSLLIYLITYLFVFAFLFLQIYVH